MSIYILIIIFVILLLLGIIYLCIGKNLFASIWLIIAFILLTYICKMMV
ncbi:MAG: hypothetical protein HFJ41_01145 [Clostridia bacterium]|nr:hypothetical protein [Clostridia bacterium]